MKINCTKKQQNVEIVTLEKEISQEKNTFGDWHANLITLQRR